MNTNARKHLGPSLITCVVLFALAAEPAKLWAATLTVTSTADSGPGTLRAALASAANGDTINFSLTTPARIILTNGELLVAKSVSILGPGPDNLVVDGNAVSGVFGIGSNAVAAIAGLTVTNGYVTYPRGGGGIHNDHATLSISNCVLSANVAYVGSCGGGRGGGIYNNHGVLTVSDCVLSGNAAGSGGCGQGRGGAIFNDGSAGNATVLLVNTLVSNNVGEVGSAIQNTASDGGVANVDIVHSILIGNSFGGFGGRAIDNYGFHGLANVRLLDSTVSGHSSGGIINQDGTLSISNSTLSANSTSSGFPRGGAILNVAVSGGTSTVEIANSTLSQNSAYYGGAVANYIDFGGGSAILRILNSTLSGNTAAEGGGINNQGNSFVDTNAIMEILNCTFSGNTSGFTGDCIRNFFGRVALGSTILNASDSGQSIFNWIEASTVTSLGYNLVSDGGSGLLTNVTDQINTDPLLGPLQANGGPTFTHAFISCSPAIDRGKNFASSATDQRGVQRSYDDPAQANASGGDGTDIGAFEAQSHVPDITPPNLTCPADIFANETPGTGTRVVTFAPEMRDNCDPSPTMSCTPSSGSTFSLGTTTVTCQAADALGNSNQCSFTITICPITITVTTTNDSGPGSLRQAIADANACVGKNIIEFAPSAYGTILLTSGELLITDELCLNGPGVTNVAVDGNAIGRVFHIAPSDTVSITSLTITNGSSDGGGVWNDHGTLLLSNVMVSGSGNFGGFGGGILNDGFNTGSARLTLINSRIFGNSATSGGGIFNGGEGGGNATLLISNSVINANAGGEAGAISNYGRDGTALVILATTTLNGNTSGAGGGIFNFHGEVQIVNSTLSDNSGGSNGGGGVLNYLGSVWITNSTFSGNFVDISFGAAGGAILNYARTPAGTASVCVVNSTFSRNTASVGGSVENEGGEGSAILTVASTIFHSGAAGGTIHSFFIDTITSLGFNLSSDNGSGFLTNATDQINTDPLLGPLQDNGGPTFTHALLCGSPAIDKGTNFSGAVTDQRGFLRTFDRPQNANVPGGDGSDIGAFEAQQFCTPFLSHFGVTSNRFGFNINAESNQLVAVDASTNLTGWTALATNAIGGAPLRFNDTNPPSPSRLFYRARTQ